MKSRITIFSTIFFLFSSSFSLISQTIYVPTDYPTIQLAIDEADSGDVVIIEEGTYYEQFSFKGKEITVGSRYLIDYDTSHISNTIIDGTFLANRDSASLVYYTNGETQNSVLCGLTLQNGKGSYAVVPNYHDFRYGGAIEIYEAGATIRKNIIRNCYCISNAWMNTGAIDCYKLPQNKTIVIEDNLIEGNSASGGNRAFGGAIECEDISGTLIINKNIIKNNSIDGYQITGGAGICVLYSNSEDIIISNNFIDNNYCNSRGTTHGGAIYIVDSRKVNILNNIFSDNKCLSEDSFGGGIGIGNWLKNDNITTAKVDIINNTIINNSAKKEGGGISLINIEAVMMNNIIRSNSADYKDQLSFRSMPISPIIIYSNIEGGFEGEGNIDADPEFCDSTFCILPTSDSPCIDAGNPHPGYNDKDVDPFYPARGTARNDLGAFGGPNSEWAEMSIIPNDPTSVKGYFDVIPAQYSLSQNYPNPFNPSTIIKYRIPRNEKRETLNVKLVVFDILGSEVVTLVNKQQKPGNYEVTWDAINLPSGIYFYKLNAENFKDLKKMILLK